MRTRTWFSPEWATHWFIVIMLAGLPLWFWKGGYTDLTDAKFFFAAAVTGVWIIATAVTAIGTKQGISMTIDKWVMLLLVVTAGVASVLSPFPDHVWLGSGRYNGFLSIALYGVIYIGVASYGKMRRSYVYVFITALFLCCVVSVFQLLGKNPFSLYPGDWNYYDKGIRYSSEFLGNVGNVDLFGALLCLGIPLAAGTILFEKKLRPLLLLMTAACLFIAVKMDVKATLLGTGMGLLLLLIIGLKPESKEIRKKTAVLFVIFAVAAGLAMTVTFSEQGISLGGHKAEADNEVQTAIDREDLGNILNGQWSDEMGSSRIGIWRTLISSVPEHFWIGTGPGTVVDRANIVFERYVPETGQTLKARVDNAHNEFLEYLVCEGIIGLMLYLLLIMITTVRAARSRETPKIILLIALISYWIQSFFGLGLILVLPVVFLFWGLENK